MDPTKTPESVSAEINPQVAEAVNAIKPEIAKELGEKIIGALGGNQTPPENQTSWEREGRAKPKDLNELLAEATTRSKREIISELEQKRKQEEERTQRFSAAKKAVIENKEKREWSSINQQFANLEESGAIEKLNPQVQAKIDKGVPLSEAEKKLPAIQQRALLVNIAQETKSNNIELTYYRNQAAVKERLSAPVSGVTPAQPVNSSDFTYEEILHARQTGNTSGLK